MAVYQKLLLSAGGGIVSPQQQATQAENTVSVLIGLGGTGIDCIRAIKTQVYSRLKPDNPEAVLATYSHIRFLGVDTTKKARGYTEETTEAKADALVALEDTEFFSIANSDVEKAFKTPLALKSRSELAWLRWEDIDTRDFGKVGTGGIRQIGRYMIMDKSERFLHRIYHDILDASSGWRGRHINFHIFSGLSGGTGASCFLDVCYMIRSIAERIGNVNILGYFFLPDVNLSKIPFWDIKTREYITKNGYASMQELDYCMQLQYNGGSFIQEKSEHRKKEWKTAPVDMCHLVCATNSESDTLENAYNYAINVTAEYVMDFLASSTNAKFDLSQQLSNFHHNVRIADSKKEIGSNLAYCLIGASCANIPMKEINTYLASALFNQFSSIAQNVPSKMDVERLAVHSLTKDAQNVIGIYDLLYREIQNDVYGTYERYTDDWKYVRDYGNRELIAHYTNQTENKLKRIGTNCQIMVTPGNQNSLIGRVMHYLDTIIRDINYGPIFAYKMISSAESHNLFNIINVLIEENSLRRNQEASSESQRYIDYTNAKANFEYRQKRSFFDNDKKRFCDYEYYLMRLEQHRLSMAIYTKLDFVLKKYKHQVSEAAETYYIKLAKIMDTLIQTFSENRVALTSEKIMQKAGSFSIPMMTIAELKNSLDAEIDQINVPRMLDAFMLFFLNNQDKWLDEDENKISKLVNDFFIKTAFNGFANRTITSFLKDKYGLTNNELLAERIYQDWVTLLVEKANPLRCFNGSIWSYFQTSKLAFLSIPSISTPIKVAAEKMYQKHNIWEIKESALTDRIFVMCSACALPLSAVNNTGKYEHICFSTPKSERHYSEGNKVDGLVFDNWSKLPSLTPQSMIKLDHAPDELKKSVLKARKLYDEAEAAGIFDDQNRICKLSDEDISSIRAKAQICTQLSMCISRPEQLHKAEAALNDLDSAMAVKLIRTEYAIRNDVSAKKSETRKSVRKDYFVSAPTYQIFVEAILKEINEVKEIAELAKTKLTEKMNSISQELQWVRDYCDAVFSGVISIEGRQIIYHQTNYGVTTDYILSSPFRKFTYSSIPVYQGFLSYCALDADIKNEIMNIVEKRFYTDTPELFSTAEKLKVIFTKDKINAWASLASRYPNSMEIVEFLKELVKLFYVFCLEIL